jgi:hypothetical protein
MDFGENRERDSNVPLHDSGGEDAFGEVREVTRTCVALFPDAIAFPYPGPGEPTELFTATPQFLPSSGLSAGPLVVQANVHAADRPRGIGGHQQRDHPRMWYILDGKNLSGMRGNKAAGRAYICIRDGTHGMGKSLWTPAR